MNNKNKNLLLIDKLNNHTCKLTDKHGLIVQFSMLIAAILILVLKRKYDKPPRKFIIWLLDISKIGFSQFSGHIFNVVIALIMNQHNKNVDQCIFYLESIMVQDSISVFTI